ncbi:MAG TPA: V-type ATP synthase subunit D [Natronosporangium sp.]
MVRVPPGRSGRLWLIRRRAAGEHAADLLDRKLRILRSEHGRLRQQANRAAAEWRAACRRADTWGLRAALTGGQRALRLAAAEPAVVEFGWEQLMGTRYPGTASIVDGATPAIGCPGGAALVEAAAAYRTALRAAASHAAADAALRVVTAEIDATRRRLRAITEQWLPRLDTALRERNRQLAEAELAETARLRWATRPARRDRIH